MFHGFARTTFGLLLFAFGFFIMPAGCGKSGRAASAVNDEGYIVHLDRSANGAAEQTGPGTDSHHAGPRMLSFEMAAWAQPVADPASQEQRTASQQAAIIEALGKAMIEARRARGQPTADFTAKIGKRLNVTHRTVHGGYELDVSILCRGVETHFLVLNGELQHPPHDFKLLQRVFDETNGEFALLATDWNRRDNRWEARVACYRPPGFDTALAGDTTERVITTP